MNGKEQGSIGEIVIKRPLIELGRCSLRDERTESGIKLAAWLFHLLNMRGEDESDVNGKEEVRVFDGESDDSDLLVFIQI